MTFWILKQSYFQKWVIFFTVWVFGITLNNLRGSQFFLVGAPHGLFKDHQRVLEKQHVYFCFTVIVFSFEFSVQFQIREGKRQNRLSVNYDVDKKSCHVYLKQNWSQLKHFNKLKINMEKLQSVYCALFSSRIKELKCLTEFSLENTFPQTFENVTILISMFLHPESTYFEWLKFLR